MKATCEYCGNEVEKSTLIELDGKWYCEDCVATCDDCGELFIRDDMIYMGNLDRIVCETCFDDKYFLCHDCDEYYSNDDGNYIDSIDDYVCSTCYFDNYGTCNSCGYSCSRDYLHYSDRDDCDYCDDCYDSEYEDEGNQTYRYHSELGRDDYSKGYRYRVGVELEREDTDFKNNLVKEDYLDNYGWVIEEDGSLGNGGFEAISPICPLKIGKLTADFKKKELRALARATFTQRCGGHITISDVKRTPDELIDDIGGYLPILYALFPNRTPNNYCYVLNKDGYKTRGGHTALNKRSSYKGSGLEIRLFDAPKDEKDLLNRFRLVKYMLQHKASTINKGLRELSNSDRLRKIVKYHLDTYKISYQDFYTNIVKYAREVDKTNINNKSVGRIATKLN